MKISKQAKYKYLPAEISLAFQICTKIAILYLFIYCGTTNSKFNKSLTKKSWSWMNLTSVLR